MRRGAAPAVAGLWAAACASAADEPPTFPEAVSTHFHVACHHPCGGRAAAAADVAEAALGQVLVLLGGADSAERMRIHLYPAADFEDVARARARGRFRENLGFTVPSEGVAHVGVQDDTGTFALPDLRRIAHEAAHLSAARILGGGGLPEWLAEGLATWVEREVGLGRADFASRLHDPWLAVHAWRALRLRDRGALPSPADIVGGTGHLGRAERYAVSSVFFHFLRHRRWELLEALLAAAPDERRLEAVLRRGLSQDLEREFESWVAALADSIPWGEALPRTLPGR